MQRIAAAMITMKNLAAIATVASRLAVWMSVLGLVQLNADCWTAGARFYTSTEPSVPIVPRKEPCDQSLMFSMQLKSLTRS